MTYLTRLAYPILSQFLIVVQKPVIPFGALHDFWMQQTLSLPPKDCYYPERNSGIRQIVLGDVSPEQRSFLRYPPRVLHVLGFMHVPFRV